MKTNKIDFCRDKSLKELSSWHIGGTANYFIEVTTVERLLGVLQWCWGHNERYIIIGRGSNILFDDRGFDGLVIKNRIDFFNREENLFSVGSGNNFGLLSRNTAQEGFTGLEFGAGIPGSVGGAIFMNAGAHGMDTASVVHSVDYIDSEGNFCTIDREGCCFDYRYSSFQEDTGRIIVGASFLLECSQDACDRMTDMLKERAKNFSSVEGYTAGSVFRNPGTFPAWKLIDELGLRGYQVGGAKVSESHANVIVNDGDALASDVLALIRLIQDRVREHYGVELKTEIRYVPYVG